VVYFSLASLIAAFFAAFALFYASVSTSSGAGVQSVALLPFSSLIEDI
jgi:hypothetical protein